MVMKDSVSQPAHASHLFMLRVWLEDLGQGKTDWRGKVQHVNSGEVRYFRDWPAMESFIEGLIRAPDEKDDHTTGMKEIQSPE